MPEDVPSTVGAKTFMTPEVVAQIRQQHDEARNRKMLGAKIANGQSSEFEDKVNDYIFQHQTWRASFPGFRTVEYWRLRAAYYPYIAISEKSDDFFLRGVTCHPRLSEYPMCGDVIRDYFNCRDSILLLYMFNTCTPLKEQMSACINNVFVRNHRRADTKFNAERKEFFEERREKRFKRMIDTASVSSTEKGKLQD